MTTLDLRSALHDAGQIEGVAADIAQLQAQAGRLEANITKLTREDAKTHTLFLLKS